MNRVQHRGPFFATLFADGSCGGWVIDRHEKLGQIDDCRAVGLEPVAIVVCRPKPDNPAIYEVDLTDRPLVN